MDDMISFADREPVALAMKVDREHGCTCVARTWTARAAAECRRCDTCTARPVDPAAPAGPWYCLLVAAALLSPADIVELGIEDDESRRGVTVGCGRHLGGTP